MRRPRRLSPAAHIAIALLGAGAAAAEPLPPGSIGVFGGGVSGTGPDAKALGLGYLAGGHAAWQPTSTEDRLGYSLKIAAAFGGLSLGDAARIDSTIKTVQLDLMVGIRVRPGDDPSRYLTLRAGGALLRANQQLPPDMHRSHAGFVASFGVEQHLWGLLFNLDVRYGLIGDRPSTLGLVLGIAKAGP